MRLYVYSLVGDDQAGGPRSSAAPLIGGMTQSFMKEFSEMGDTAVFEATIPTLSPMHEAASDKDIGRARTVA